ncbi:hypothetical protein BN1050_00522 [Metalysinibacillus saudimassiliensis]|uniref:Uncharacterized protein n=1 Tax=Metalysinibacillus saudimassiliensis TaxID=1461583 RepID=A0A078LYN5_9BACL|nr:hypothetical protein BN1050_00522 [Metalysinibacillus saudimassiliensis]
MKTHSILLGSMGVAVLLGIFGQHATTFIATSIPFLHPLYVLTALTLCSIAIFIFVPYYAVRSSAKLGTPLVITYILLDIVLCIGTSFWSIFVLAIWWG